MVKMFIHCMTILVVAFLYLPPLVFAHSNEMHVIDFSSTIMNGSGITCVSHNTRFESRYDDSPHLYFSNGSFVSCTFQVHRWPEKVVMKVKHLSSATQGRPGYTPVAVLVNGKPIDRITSLEAGYTVSRYDITSRIGKGVNSIAFVYDQPGETGYWQKWIKIRVKLKSFHPSRRGRRPHPGPHYPPPQPVPVWQPVPIVYGQYCCDVGGNHRCILTNGPLPAGNPCVCFGQGTGHVCP